MINISQAHRGITWKLNHAGCYVFMFLFASAQNKRNSYRRRDHIGLKGMTLGTELTLIFCRSLIDIAYRPAG